MHILFTRFPFESIYGGAEVQTLSLMRGLRERGHEVGFLGSCPVLLQKATSYELRATRLDIGVPPVTKWGAVSFLWRQRAMQKKLRDNFQFSIFNFQFPDVVCMLSLSEKLLLTAWAVQRSIRVFWIEHDRVGRWLQWNPWLWKLRRLSRLATTVVVSDLSKRIYVELGWDPEKIVVIPNGIDPTHFLATKGSTVPPHPDRTLWERENLSPLRIGCIARLAWEKGVDLLMEAVKDLPHVHLTIVGTGRKEHHLRQLAQRIMKNEHACPAGRQRITIVSSVHDVAAFYRSLDIFILPSRDHDPCPLAPIEAMACGVPVILTDVCGTAGYLEHDKDALIVPSNSSGALREAISRLLDDGDLRLRLAERGPQVVAERFSIERMVEEYERAFDKKPFLLSPFAKGERSGERGG